MKHLFFLIFLLLAVFPSRAQIFEVTPENTQYIVQKRERARTVVRLRDDLLGGTWLLWYDVEKTRKVEQCTYKQEERHGKYIEWYLNQQVKRTVNYDEGYKVGMETIYYENGQKMSVSSAHSASDTVCDRKEWYKSGELRYDERREGNKRLGTIYYKDGKVKCEQMAVYTDNEDILIPQYKPRTEICRCKNGNVLYNIVIKTDSITPVKEYHCGGQLRAEGNMIESRSYKVGEWKYYRADGSRERTENYRPVGTLRGAGIKEGDWFYYGEDDKIIKQEVYENGRLKETRRME